MLQQMVDDTLLRPQDQRIAMALDEEYKQEELSFLRQKYNNQPIVRTSLRKDLDVSVPAGDVSLLVITN